jgi:hypothetical protein
MRGCRVSRPWSPKQRFSQRSDDWRNLQGDRRTPGQPEAHGFANWLDIEIRSWFAGRILPVTEAIAERWGHLAAAAAKQKGTTLAVVDGVIAATALHHDLSIVTRNVKDFAGLGADVVNPFEAGSPAPKRDVL